MPKTEVFDPQKWWTGVKGDTEMSDDATKAMETLLADPNIAKNIGNSVLRQSDYSRQSDALKAETDALAVKMTEVETAKAESDAFVIKQKDRDHNNLALHEQLVKDLATANARTTELGGEVTEARTETVIEKEPEVAMLSIKDYEAREAARDAQTIQFSSRMITLANQHRKEFGEDFEPDAVVTYATEKGLTLDDAYTELNAEKFAAKREADIQIRIDTAVKENEIELRSKVDFPETVSGPTRVSGLDQKDEDKLKTEDARTAAALAGLAKLRATQ